MGGHFSWYEQLPFYETLLHAMREMGIVGEHQGITQCFSAAIVVLFLLVVGILVRSKLSKTEERIIPSGKVGLSDLFEVGAERLRGLVHSTIPHNADRHVPLLAGLFLYIFFNNLLGMIPGAPPATSTISNNLAMGVIIFLYYNLQGLREHGMGYIKHFLGPLWWLAPLMLVIELISHAVRPISLSLRLAGNITGDHMVLGIFNDLTYLIVPIIFNALGVFVCFVQAFVFTLLSAVYISMATSHDH